MQSWQKLCTICTTKPYKGLTFKSSEFRAVLAACSHICMTEEQDWSCLFLRYRFNLLQCQDCSTMLGMPNNAWNDEQSLAMLSNVIAMVTQCFNAGTLNTKWYVLYCAITKLKQCCHNAGTFWCSKMLYISLYSFTMLRNDEKSPFGV